MRGLWILLALLVFPAVNAQTGLYAKVHNVTYTLGPSSFEVEEVIVFGNTGDPFTFIDTISLSRGDAWDIEVDGAPYTIEKRHPVTQNRIKIDLFISKGQERTITITYRRSDLMATLGDARRFTGYGLGKYAWLVHLTNIAFITSDGYYFGGHSGSGVKTREGDHETLTYQRSILTNLSAIREGVFLEVDYARYKDMASEDLARAETLVEEATYDVQSANQTLMNARGYGDVSGAEETFSRASKYLDAASTQLQMAKLNFDPMYASYYEAHARSEYVVNLAKNASRNARMADSQADQIVQKSLEDKIAQVDAGLAEQKQLASSLETAPPQVVTLEEGPAFPFKYLILVLFMVAVIVVLLKVPIKNPDAQRASKVADFKNIDDLKRKTFTGFEKKVSAVKEGVEIATQIRTLRSEKEKLEFGIENLRKKKIAGEMRVDVYEKERDKMEFFNDTATTEIYTLEAELKEVKRPKK
jgi:hypothetical protein